MVEAIIQHNTTSPKKKLFMIYPDTTFKLIWDNILLM